MSDLFIYGEEAQDLYKTAQTTYPDAQIPPPACVECRGASGYTRVEKSPVGAFVVRSVGIGSYFQTDKHLFIPLMSCASCEGYFDGYRNFTPSRNTLLPKEMMAEYHKAYSRGQIKRKLVEKMAIEKRIEEEETVKKEEARIRSDVRARLNGSSLSRYEEA